MAQSLAACHELHSLIFLAAWLSANVYIFTTSFLLFSRHDRFTYSRDLMGDSLSWAKSAAQCLNLNSALVLIPVCRNIVTTLADACGFRVIQRQLDKSVGFHQLVANAIILFTVIHVCAHVCLWERLTSAWRDPDSLRGALTHLGEQHNQTYLNPVRDPHLSTLGAVLWSVAGLSGVSATLSLAASAASSGGAVRLSAHRCFSVAHPLLALAFLASILVHGLRGVVRGQTDDSLRHHNTSVCADRFRDWGRDPQCPVPQFAGTPPSTWKWVLPSLLLYCLDCCMVAYCCAHPVTITKVVRHPSSVLEVRWLWNNNNNDNSAPSTTATAPRSRWPGRRGVERGCWGAYGRPQQAGRWVLLRCDAASRCEWHPFTLTSAPGEREASVHVRQAGVWTAALHTQLGGGGGRLPSLQVLGPYGAGCGDMVLFPVSVCIGSGIGITPFASVLKSIVLLAEREGERAGEREQERRLCVYWVAPDTRCFEWLSGLLVSAERRLAELGRGSTLTTRVFLTRWDRSQAEHAWLHHEEERDVVTGTRDKIHFGRPDWQRELHTIAAHHPGQEVCVSVCGDAGVCCAVKAACRAVSSSTSTSFAFRQETF